VRAVGKNIVGIIGGSVGSDPFNRRTWSGSSYFLFTEMKRQNLLGRAFGIEVPSPWRQFYLAKSFTPNRRRWRARFYADAAYRAALTREIQNRLSPEDLGQTLLQIGAMFDVPGAVGDGTTCVSYHDGSLAEAVNSPFWAGELTTKEIDWALAYERHVYHGVDRVLAMSEYLRQSFIRNFDLPAGKVVNVGCGVNFEEIPEPSPDKRYNTREVLFIGVEFKRKGGWVLLKAFRGLHAHYTDARLHIVGPRQLTIPPDLGTAVQFHGYLQKNDPAGKAKLEELFRRCSLFVMPSLYEPFGIAPLEAMAYQIPCVVTNAWALKEMVTPGVNGDLVEVGSVDELETKLIALLADADGLRRMGEAGRRIVLSTFTWSHVVRRIGEALPA
jgi:hypothetical protein